MLLPKTSSVLKVVADAHRLKPETGSWNVQSPQALTALQMLECGKKGGGNLKFHIAINSENAMWAHGYASAVPCQYSVFLNNRAYCFNKNILLVTFFPLFSVVGSDMSQDKEFGPINDGGHKHRDAEERPCCVFIKF